MIKPFKEMRFSGWDLSLNHGACVTFKGDNLANYTAFVAKNPIRNYKNNCDHVISLDLPTPVQLPAIKDNRLLCVMRRKLWRQFLPDYLRAHNPDYVCLEDYAYRAAQKAHQLGELGGTARDAAYDHGAALRLHDPASLKLFAAHNGNANKEDMIDAVKKRWGEDFSEIQKPPKVSVKAWLDMLGDLADAYSLGRYVITEMKLRLGLVDIATLHHKEIESFNRVTKTYPINVLSSNFVVNPEIKDSLCVPM